MSDTTDLLDRIEELTSCGECGAALDERARSGDFCCEEHQDAWHARRGIVAPTRVSGGDRAAEDRVPAVLVPGWFSPVEPHHAEFLAALNSPPPVEAEAVQRGMRFAVGLSTELQAALDHPRRQGRAAVQHCAEFARFARWCAGLPELELAPTRTEVMDRALEARRNRNTGPAVPPPGARRRNR